MRNDPFIHVPTGCEACQWQLSELADSGALQTPELRAHLAGCVECAEFAEQWLHEAPAALARPVSTTVATPLRERILDAAARPDIVRLPAPTARRPAWTALFGRVAACLALAGFAYWLLNPVASPVVHRPSAAVGPTLEQGLTQMENKSRHEQEVLETALADGGRQVQGNVAWSVSALDL